MGNFEKIVKGAFWYFLGMGSASIFTYIGKIIIARFLGPFEYGKFVFGLTILYLANIFAVFGLQDGLALVLPRKKDKGRVIFNAIFIAVITSFIVAIILATFNDKIAQFFEKEEMREIIKLVAILLVFYSLNNVLSGVLRGFENAKAVSELNSLRGFLFMLLGGLSAYLFKVGEAVMESYIVIYILIVMIYFSLIKGKIKIAKIEKKVIIELISYSLPLFLLGIIMSLMRWTDILMLGYFVPSEKIGIYSVAISTAFVLNMVLGAFVMLFLPVISKVINEGKLKEAGRLYKRTCSWITAIVSPFFAIMMLFPKQLINILFGHNYIEGYILLLPLGFAALVNTILGPNVQLLISMNKRKKVMLIMLATLTANIIMNYFLIQRYGILGAGIATSIALMTWNIGITWEIYKEIKVIPITATSIKMITIAFALSIITYTVKSFFGTLNIVGIGIFSFVFFSLYSIIAYYSLPEREKLKELILKKLA